jgi:hypothetical protein
VLRVERHLACPSHFMKPTIWLILSIVWFAIGFTDAENVVAYLGRPLGAIFFGAWLISSCFRDEVKKYEAEQRAKLATLPPEYRKRVLEEELDRPERVGAPIRGPVPHIT